MTVAGHRHERIAEEVRNEVGAMLAGELKDPRIEAPVLVTEVRVSPDLKLLRIFVSIAGSDAEKAVTLRGLEAAAGFVRHELVERLRLRKSPQVKFERDDSVEYAQRIEDLLRKAKTES